jgi:hypothetical protein
MVKDTYSKAPTEVDFSNWIIQIGTLKRADYPNKL